MKSHCLPCCRGCRFYHGANGLVCAVHPYGSSSDTCVDFNPKVEDKNQIGLNKKHPTIADLQDLIMWLFIYMLFFTYSIGLIVWLGKASSDIQTPKSVTPVSRNLSYHPIKTQSHSSFNLLDQFKN